MSIKTSVPKPRDYEMNSDSKLSQRLSVCWDVIFNPGKYSDSEIKSAENYLLEYAKKKSLCKKNSKFSKLPKKAVERILERIVIYNDNYGEIAKDINDEYGSNLTNLDIKNMLKDNILVRRLMMRKEEEMEKELLKKQMDYEFEFDKIILDLKKQFLKLQELNPRLEEKDRLGLLQKMAQTLFNGLKHKAKVMGDDAPERISIHQVVEKQTAGIQKKLTRADFQIEVKG